MRVMLGLLVSMLTFPLIPASADDAIGQATCARPVELRFAPDATAAVVSGTLTREQVGCYTFGARRGQTLDIAMTADSTENATAVVFEPGWTLKKDEDVTYTDGKELPGAGRGDVAQHVHARLPVTGRYLVMAAPSRGGAASYTMRVSIH